MSTINMYQERRIDQPPEPDEENQGLSGEMRGFLEGQSKEAEIQAAMDAAAEEGIILTRDQVAEILSRPPLENSPK